MSNLRPKITIIIAVFNGAKTLQSCLDSIFEQSYKNWELIIIDGGSSDGTVDILKKNAFNIAYWETKPDRGIYHAWNKALEHVTGEWIMFLGADDYLWEPSVLGSLAHEITALEGRVSVIYGIVNYLAPDHRIARRLGEPWEIARRRFYHEMSIPHVGALHHRRLFSTYGTFDKTLKIAGDYEFLMRVFTTEDAYFVSSVTVAGQHHGGISDQLGTLFRLTQERIRIRRQHNLMPVYFWPLLQLIKAFVFMAAYKLSGPKGTRALSRFYRKLRGRYAT